MMMLARLRWVALRFASSRRRGTQSKSSSILAVLVYLPRPDTRVHIEGVWKRRGMLLTALLRFVIMALCPMSPRRGRRPFQELHRALRRRKVEGSCERRRPAPD